MLFHRVPVIRQFLCTSWFIPRTYTILTFLPFTCSAWYFRKWTFLGEWQCHTARQLPWKAGQPAGLLALRSRNRRPTKAPICNSQPRNASPSLGCPVRSRGFVFNSSQHVILRAEVGVEELQYCPGDDGSGLGTPPQAGWRHPWAWRQKEENPVLGSQKGLLVPII